MSDELIDQSQQKKLDGRGYEVLFRILFLGGLLYVLKIFFDYYLLYRTMDSPLLPNYVINYMYGSNHALHGVYAISALILSYLIQWIGNTKIALVVMGFFLIGGIVLISLTPIEPQ